jgi:cobalamin biosynthesis protein CobT
MTLEHEMIRVGRIVAAEQGLDIRVQGTKAYASEGCVTIPNVEVYAWLGRFAKRMLHGLLDHECAHAVFSDLRLYAACVTQDLSEIRASFARKSRTPSPEFLLVLKVPIYPRLLNIVEDSWIERKQGERYIGSKQNLDSKNRWFIDQPGTEEMLKGEDKIGAMLQMFCLVSRGAMTLDQVRQRAPEIGALLATVEDLTITARACNSTVEATDVAHELYLRIQQQHEKQEQEKKEQEKQEQEAPGEPGEGEPGEPTPDDQGDDQDDQEPAQGQGPTEGDPEDGDSDGEPQAGPEGTEDGEGEQDENVPDIPDPAEWADDGKPMDPEGSIQSTIDQYFEENNNDEYIKFSDEYDIEVDLSSKQGALSLDQIEAEAEVATSALTHAFEASLRARREKRWVTGHDEGFVDMDVMGEFAVGSMSADSIYFREEQEDSDDVAVSLLVDSSGSMSSRYRLAAVTAMAFHKALAAVQISHEVCGFTTARTSDIRHMPWLQGADREHANAQHSALKAALNEAKKRGTDISQFARCTSARRGDVNGPIHAILKRFNDPSPLGITNVTSAVQNLDGEALLWQARRLAERSERRRVIFVISDGHPTGSKNTGLSALHLRNTISKVLQAGIEVYGIGICSQSVKSYYPRSWVVNDVEELCQVALTGLTEILTEDRQEHKWVAGL